MTFAWYGHLRFKALPLWQVVIFSWLIALGEYCFQVPANRFGYGQFTAYQAKDHSGSHHAYSVLHFFDNISE
jgi:Uncharacterized protein conserved in bacteria